jgi:hypothetical protein
MLTPRVLLEDLQSAPKFTNSQHCWSHCLNEMSKQGVILEFGVGNGFSMRYMAARTSLPIIGFDSFMGLPEEWNNLNPQGAYSTNGKLPANMPANCRCIVGLFQDTVSDFLRDFHESIAMVHLDADLYSSTIYVLRQLTSRLNSGVIVNFNEFAGYPEWEEHEAKALAEWLNETGKTVAPIGRTGGAYSQAAYRVLS